MFLRFFFFFSIRSFHIRLKHNMGHIILRSPILSPTMFKSFLLFSVLTLKVAIKIQRIRFILRRQWFVALRSIALNSIVGYFHTYNVIPRALKNSSRKKCHMFSTFGQTYLNYYRPLFNGNNSDQVYWMILSTFYHCIFCPSLL